MFSIIGLIKAVLAVRSRKNVNYKRSVCPEFPIFGEVPENLPILRSSYSPIVMQMQCSPPWWRTALSAVCSGSDVFSAELHACLLYVCFVPLSPQRGSTAASGSCDCRQWRLCSLWFLGNVAPEMWDEALRDLRAKAKLWHCHRRG